MKSLPLPILLFLLVSSAFADRSESIRKFWFNGAEINRYALSQTRYGDNHPGHAEFIFVTEPFLTEKQVKHEFGNEPSTNVLKLNALRTFNTGIYAYRTMTSTFKPINTDSFPHALKSTTSVQDWCGQAFQQMNRHENGWQAQLFSYFQTESDASVALGDAWLEDELWLQIRLDPSNLPQGDFQAIPGALFYRFTHEPITITSATGKLQTEAKLSRYELHYPALQYTLGITFDTEFPHIIRSWFESSPNGTTTAVLADRIMNSNYWSENRPEDRKKRKQLGLEPIPN